MECVKCGYPDCAADKPLDPRYLQSIRDSMGPYEPGDKCTYQDHGDAYMVAGDLLRHMDYMEEKFIAALEKFGDHTDTCSIHSIAYDVIWASCDCGYEKALSGIV